MFLCPPSSFRGVCTDVVMPFWLRAERNCQILFKVVQHYHFEGMLPYKTVLYLLEVCPCSACGALRLSLITFRVPLPVHFIALICLCYLTLLVLQRIIQYEVWLKSVDACLEMYCCLYRASSTKNIRALIHFCQMF